MIAINENVTLAQVSSNAAEFAEAVGSATCLAITPDEEHLVEALGNAWVGQPFAILTVSDELDVFADPELQSSIEQILDNGDMKQVLLVGGLIDSGTQQEIDDAGVKLDAKRIGDSLVHGACLSNAINRNAREQFAAQVEQFVRTSAIYPRWQANEISVGGLFFRDCDRVFLFYDPRTEEFRPLPGN